VSGDRCPRFEQLSTAFSDAASSERAPVAVHARSCVACARVWSDFEVMRTAARAIPARAPDERAAAALEMVLVAHVRGQKASTRGFNSWLAAAIAAGVLAVASAGAWWWRSAGVKVDAPSPELAVEPPRIVRDLEVPRAPPEPVIRPSGAAHFRREAGAAHLESGALEIDVPAEQRFVLATGDAELTATAASFSVKAENDRLMFVSVTAGQVELKLGSAWPRILLVGERWARRRPRATKIDPPPLPVLKTSDERFQAAWSALNAGANQEAAAELEHLLAEEPDHPLAEDAAYWRAIALIRGERSNEAEEALTAFRARYPESPRIGEVSMFLGWRQLERGELDSAAAQFREALESPLPEIKTRATEALEAIKDR
jgi:TolA-binding protein